MIGAFFKKETKVLLRIQTSKTGNNKLHTLILILRLGLLLPFEPFPLLSWSLASQSQLQNCFY